MKGTKKSKFPKFGNFILITNRMKNRKSKNKQTKLKIKRRR